MRKTAAYFFAASRIALFILWAVVQVPSLLFFATFRQSFGVRQMRVFMAGAAKLFGIKVRAYGELDPRRPLLLVANHIGIFEIIALPAIFGNAFFAKAEVLRWPILGWYIRVFGNAFIDRRPSKAALTARIVRAQMQAAKNPFAIFPEGTTTNGDYVLPFKGAAFDSIAGMGAENAEGAGVLIQPVVILYRDKSGRKIPPQVLADEYAYFANEKQTRSPYAAQEPSIIKLLLKNIMRGGFVFEAHVMPTFDPAGMDRKQVANALHEIVSKKFEELK